MVVKEALACNIPVVAVDAGDVRERIEGVEGCLLVERTPDAVAEGIRQALAFRARPHSREAVADLSTDAVAHKVFKAYHSVASQNAGGLS